MAPTPENLVLIVEYDAWLRSTLRMSFEEAGFDVVCVSNGMAGLRRAAELKPGLIVVGARLPELSSGELAHQLEVECAYCTTAHPVVDQSRASVLKGKHM